MVDENLEKVIKERVKPLINDAMHKFLGITVAEIETDISDKLSKGGMQEISVNPNLPFREARDLFRKQYLFKLLQMHFGNVSKVAEIAGVDRRSIHRMIKKLDIDTRKFRLEMLKRDYVKQEQVKGLIEHTLEDYKSVIKEERLKEMYANLHELSKDIIKELPDAPLTLDQAERAWEERYLKEVLQKHGSSVTKAAKAIGLRYETLHRKVKLLGVSC